MHDNADYLFYLCSLAVMSVVCIPSLQTHRSVCGL